ncbi:MAG: hypothetical protein ACPGVB_05180 [Chitinophagales bacterium]
MRKLLYILTALILFSSCEKSTISPEENPLLTKPQNCEQSDLVKNQYSNDAYKLAVELMKHDEVNTSSIQIPTEYVQKAMDALMVVYNATEIPARDLVIDTYNIHALTTPNRFMVGLDTAYPWTNNWIHGNKNTGNNTIDQLLGNNNIEIVEYLGFIETVILEAKTPLNASGLLSTLNGIGGIKRVEYEQTLGDGNDIEVRSFDDYLEMTYSVGYGDCASGCRFRSYWQFKVYNDCSIEYVGNFGDPAP